MMFVAEVPRPVKPGIGGAPPDTSAGFGTLLWAAVTTAVTMAAASPTPAGAISSADSVGEVVASGTLSRNQRAAVPTPLGRISSSTGALALGAVAVSACWISAVAVPTPVGLISTGAAALTLDAAAATDSGSNVVAVPTPVGLISVKTAAAAATGAEGAGDAGGSAGVDRPKRPITQSLRISAPLRDDASRKADVPRPVAPICVLSVFAGELPNRFLTASSSKPCSTLPSGYPLANASSGTPPHMLCRGLSVCHV